MTTIPGEIYLTAMKKHWQVFFVKTPGKLIIIEHPHRQLIIYGKKHSKRQALHLINRWVRLKAHVFLNDLLYDLNKKVKGALSYPIFVVSALIIVGAVMMIFVVPQLTSVLEESGQELPFLTKIIISISDFMVGYWWLGLLIIGGLICGGWYAGKKKSG